MNQKVQKVKKMNSNEKVKTTIVESVVRRSVTKVEKCSELVTFNLVEHVR